MVRPSLLRVLALSGFLAGAALVPVGAGAQTIQQTKAEMAAISYQLNLEVTQGDITANAYDAAQGQLDQLSRNIHELQAKIKAKQAQIAKTKAVMVVDVVHSFVDGASAAQIEALFNQQLTVSDARGIFSKLVVGDLNQVRLQLLDQQHSLDQTINQVAVQRGLAAQQTAHMRSLLSQNIALQNATQHTLNKLKAQLSSQITAFIAYQVEQGAAAARVRNVAAEEQAVNAASEIGGQAAANKVLEAIRINTPPVINPGGGGSAQGAAALQAAVSQTGVPYVWGGETPGVGFDCSGLVQWAWSRAGVSIPRTTQAQWDALPHVSIHNLEPGDLIYYYNLDGDHSVDHVVMYAGSGPWGTSTIIAAAHTGTNIALEPIFTFGLIGAARP